MSLQTMGSSTLARSSPGSVLRSKDEKRAGVNIAAQQNQAQPGVATRELVEEPLETQVPIGTNKILATKPLIDRGTTAPPDLLDMGGKAQSMAAASPTAPASPVTAPKNSTGKPVTQVGGPAPGADLALAEQPLSRYLPTDVMGMPLEYKTDTGNVLSGADKMGALNDKSISQVGIGGDWADAPGELRSFGSTVSQAFQPVMRSVEQMVQNLPGAQMTSKANPFTLNLLGSRVQAADGYQQTSKLFDPNMLQAIMRSVGNAVSSVPALRSAGENLSSFANNNMRSQDYGLANNLNTLSSNIMNTLTGKSANNVPLPITQNQTLRTMASNVGAAANNVGNTLRSYAQPVTQKVTQVVNNVVNSLKNLLGGLFK